MDQLPANAPPPARDDPRRRHTRAVVRAAYADLVLARGYAGVTIGAVSARARVGRSTVYEHFPSKHDLLADSLTRPFALLAATVEPGSDPAALTGLLSHFRDHRARARVLFNGSMRQLITRRLAELIQQRLPGSPPILAFQIAGSHLALIEGWLWGGMLWSAETLAEALVISARGALQGR